MTGRNSTAANQDKKKMRKSNHNLIQSDCLNTSSEAAVENLAQLPLTRYIFLTATEEQRSFFLLCSSRVKSIIAAGLTPVDL